jgi:hypothetical protein
MHACMFGTRKNARVRHRRRRGCDHSRHPCGIGVVIRHGEQSMPAKINEKMKRVGGVVLRTNNRVVPKTFAPRTGKGQQCTYVGA